MCHSYREYRHQSITAAKVLNYNMNTQLKLIALVLAISCLKTSVNGQANFSTTADFAAERYVNIQAPRGMVVDDAGDILVVSNVASRVTAIWEEDGIAQTVVLIEEDLGLNHGITYRDGFVYASSSPILYRWPYTSGSRTPIKAVAKIVINKMPTGGHRTRIPVFRSDGLLYVSVGSDADVDPNSDRARIHRFNITIIPDGGIDWNSGEVFADGVRNEVGLAVDADDILWGVQNGANYVNRSDLGGIEIQSTNPAEELTKYDQTPGTHYGYPYCWTVDELSGHNKGDQLAWHEFMNDGVHTDEWCKNVNNNHPPTLALPAHHAPLGITFYDGANCNATGAFPCSMTGDAFVTFHAGYWTQPPVGYKVVHIPIDPQTRLPTGEILDVLFEPDTGNCRPCLRPVNVVFNRNGHMIVTVDVSNEIFRVTYTGN